LSKLFRDTGDFKHAIAGNAPVIVDRRDGSLHPTGTAHPIEHYVEQFRRRRCRLSGVNYFFGSGDLIVAEHPLLASPEHGITGRPDGGNGAVRLFHAKNSRRVYPRVDSLVVPRSLEAPRGDLMNSPYIDDFEKPAARDFAFKVTEGPPGRAGRILTFK
jgi:hypothetical protein